MAGSRNSIGAVWLLVSLVGTITVARASLPPTTSLSLTTLSVADAANQRLVDAVSSKLFLDRFFSQDKVHVEAHDGVVRLEGQVDDPRAAEMAERMSAAVRGVRRVDNRLRVAVPVRADQDIRKSLLEALRADPVTKGLSLTIRVQGGVAELAGQVDLHSLGEQAVWIAKGVLGVRGVQNKISSKPSPVGPTDRELTLRIRSRLGSDAWLAEDPLEARVTKARVSVTGRVASAAERERAEQVAWLPGARSVDISLVSVDPSIRDQGSEPLVDRNPSGVVNASDDDLRAYALEAFRYDGRLNGRSPQVTVMDRVATLRGEVEDLSERLAAEDDALSTAGILSVVDKLDVKTETAVSDADLSAELSRVLQANLSPDLSKGLGVTVNKGAVTITGAVPSAYEKWRIKDAASRTNGVASLDNQVRVVPLVEGTLQAGLSDDEIRVRVENALGRDPGLGARDQVEVKVFEGAVTLSGQVESQVRSLLATRDAFEAGARSVRTELHAAGEPGRRIRLVRGKPPVASSPGEITYSAPPAESFPPLRDPST